MSLKKCFMCITIFCLLGSASAAKAFSDLDSSHWAYEFVMRMNEKGIISGYNDGTFKPDNIMNKAEFAATISKAFSLDKYGEDVEIYSYDLSNHWAEKYIKNLSRFIGDENPSENITREEALETIVKLKGLENQEVDRTILKEFSDIGQHDTLLGIGIKNGFMSGKAEGMFCPSEFLTRAEVATLIDNILKNNGLKDEHEYKVEIDVINGHVMNSVQYYKQGDIVSIEAMPKTGYYYIQSIFKNGPWSSRSEIYLNDGVKLVFVMPANDVDIKIDFTREAGVIKTYPKNGAEGVGGNFYVDVQFVKTNYHRPNAPEIVSGFEVTDETGKLLIPVKEEVIGEIVRKTYENAQYKVANVRVFNNAWYLDRLDGKDYNFNIYYNEKTDGNYKIDLLANSMPTNKKELYFENEEVEIICDTRGYDNVELKTASGINISKISTRQENNKYIINFVMPQNDIVLELNAIPNPIIVTSDDEWAVGMVTHRITEGESIQINAEVLPSIIDDKTLVYSSDNERVARVSMTGKVTGVSEGTTKVKIKNIANNLVRDYWVHVIKQNKIQGFYYIDSDDKFYNEGDEIPDLKLTPGESYNIVLYVDGVNVDYTVICEIDNSEVVSVSDDGILKAVSPGTVAPYDVAGTLRAISPGVAHIRMTAADGKQIEFDIIVE